MGKIFIDYFSQEIIDDISENVEISLGVLNFTFYLEDKLGYDLANNNKIKIRLRCDFFDKSFEFFSPTKVWFSQDKINSATKNVYNMQFSEDATLFIQGYTSFQIIISLTSGEELFRSYIASYDISDKISYSDTDKLLKGYDNTFKAYIADLHNYTQDLVDYKTEIEKIKSSVSDIYKNALICSNIIQNSSAMDLTNKADISSVYSKTEADTLLLNYIQNTDTRLTDSRNPKTHTHRVSDIKDFPSIPEFDEIDSYSRTQIDEKLSNINKSVEATIGVTNLLNNSNREIISTQGDIIFEIGSVLQDYVSQTITVSFDIKVTTAREITVQAYQSKGCNLSEPKVYTPKLTGVYERGFITTTVTNFSSSTTNYKSSIEFLDNTGYQSMSVRKVQIELGTRNSCWKYSNTDISNMVTDGSIYKLGYTASYPKINGSFIADTSINGSSLENTTITSSKLNIEKISDIVSNLGSITSGNIRSSNYAGTTGFQFDLTNGEINEKTLIDFFFPIGYVYLTLSEISPQTLYGGTWEKIEGKFLISSSTEYPVTTTGGEKTHKLTVSEMPNHNHAQYVTANSELSGGTSARLDYASDGKGHIYPQGCNTSATGGGQAFNLLPPYLSVNVYKRTA